MKSLDEMRCHPLFMKMYKACDSRGYTLNRMFVNGYGTPSLHINKKEDDYHPTIYLSEENAKCDTFKYEIQTTSYGSLDMETYSKFMAACKDAYEVVELMSAVSFDEWPVLK